MKKDYKAMVTLEMRRERLLFSILSERPRNDCLDLLIGTSPDKKDKLAAKLDKRGRLTKYFRFIPYLSARCDIIDARTMANHVYKKPSFYKNDFPEVTSVELSNFLSIPKPKVRKTQFRKQDLWNLEDIGAYDAMQQSSGRDVKVAVIDTGVNYNHDEIKHCFETTKGYDFIENISNPMDQNGHGTHVAGTIAGVNCGVASGVTMYALRVLDENGEGSEAHAISALEWAVNNKMNVVNCSFGSPIASRAFEEMCAYAANYGVIIVAAAGNNGGEIGMYPAAFGRSVIGVAAVDRSNDHAYFSNIWPTNDISAPGTEILSSYLEGYATLEGTSMSAPHVTGSLALAYPFKGYECLENKMKETAMDLETGFSYDKREMFGAGLVRADAFVNEMKRVHAGMRRRHYEPSRMEKIREFAKAVVW